MNMGLWILQFLMALHTLVGAVWKFSHSEQAVPSLQAIPHGAWLAMIGVEMACSVGLILPVLNRSLGVLPAIAALGIATEMLLFVGITVHSGVPNQGQMIYWLVVAAVCAFIAYGRFVLKPA